jgi:HEPN domain-containing protein
VDKATFEANIRDVDLRLQGLGVLIPMRPIRAVGEFSKMLHCNLPLSSPFGELRLIEGYYEGESLAAHVLHWMQRRYGTRLSIEPSMGAIGVELRCDAWRMRMPFIIASKDNPFFPGWFRILISTEPRDNLLMMGDKLNVLDLIEGLTQDLANDLTEAEAQSLVQAFIRGYRVHHKFAFAYRDSQLARAVHNDLNNAARDMLDARTFGWSRFESQQAAEKSLKLFIELAGESYGRIHKLGELYRQCTALGLSGIDPDDLVTAQCEMGVRYEPQGHSVMDALRAHNAAIKICAVVAAAVPDRASDETA